MNVKTLKHSTKTTFHYLSGINRPVNPTQVTKLAESLQRLGCIRPIIISELDFVPGHPKAKFIIDGQHLFNALMRAGMDIPYVEIKVSSMTDLVEKIALLNASSKSWDLTDYVLAWSMVHEDYLLLDKYFKMFDFDLGTIASILMGANGITASGHSNKPIKNGTFRVVDETKKVDVLHQVTDVLKIVPRSHRFFNRYICREYIIFFRRHEDHYDHKRFMKNLENSKISINLATQEPNKLVQIFETLL